MEEVKDMVERVVDGTLGIKIGATCGYIENC